jgi:hypothetical protein
MLQTIKAELAKHHSLILKIKFEYDGLAKKELCIMMEMN